MYYVLVMFVGVAIGAACMFLFVMERFSKIGARETTLKQSERSLAEHESRMRQEADALKRQAGELTAKQREFDKRVISYGELHDENAVLKRDLRNLDLHLGKSQLDHETSREKHESIDARSQALARRYLAETVKGVIGAIGSNNFSACKQRLLDVIARCREIGFAVTGDEEQKLLADLRSEFELAVRAAFEREEQARIKAQIREEEKLKREVEREMRQLDRERLAIQAALDRALAEANDRHSDEVDHLRMRLAEAEEKSRRAISMAQQTKAGNVYVISNIGSFGTGIYKIGMTRRLEPKDRVKELCGAAVPFPYDVHMMIGCTDAPKLENALHRALHQQRVNKANPRKEFFKTDIMTIVDVVKKHHGEVLYSADAEALEYRQSISMPAEDALFIEQVYEAIEEEDIAVDD